MDKRLNNLEGGDKEKIEGEKGLENYCSQMRSLLSNDKLKDQFEGDDKEKFQAAVQNVLEVLDKNQLTKKKQVSFGKGNLCVGDQYVAETDGLQISSLTEAAPSTPATAPRIGMTQTPSRKKKRRPKKKKEKEELGSVTAQNAASTLMDTVTTKGLSDSQLHVEVSGRTCEMEKDVELLAEVETRRSEMGLGGGVGEAEEDADSDNGAAGSVRVNAAEKSCDRFFFDYEALDEIESREELGNSSVPHKPEVFNIGSDTDSDGNDAPEQGTGNRLDFAFNPSAVEFFPADYDNGACSSSECVLQADSPKYTCEADYSDEKPAIEENDSISSSGSEAEERKTIARKTVRWEQQEAEEEMQRVVVDEAKVTTMVRIGQQNFLLLVKTSPERARAKIQEYEYGQLRAQAEGNATAARTCAEMIKWIENYYKMDQ